MTSHSKKHEPFEVPNQFAIQHGNYKLEETIKAGVRRARNKNVLVLDTYLSKEQITKNQFDAGITLYSLWLRAGGTQRTIISYEKVRYGRIDDLNEKNILAKKRMNEAFETVGDQLSRCLFAVCCMGEYASDWAYNNDLSKRSGIDVLRLGLNELCNIWRI